MTSGHDDAATSPTGSAATVRFPLFFHALHAVERIFVAFARQREAAIHRNEDFPWVAQLEAASPAIRRELDRLLASREEIPPFQQISPEQEAITRDHRWRTFVLYAYGAKAHRNCRECPETTAAVERIPGMKTALFSILEARKHIPAHRGPYKGLLRCHLGLRIPGPPGAVRLRVGSHSALWREGSALVFDDTFDHEVWNDTDETRVVLFVDFVRPMRAPLSWINEGVLRAMVGSRWGRRYVRRFSDWYRARNIDAGV